MTDRAPGTQRRFSSALKWAFVMNSGIRVTGLVTTFVLAGILGPFDFGLASMAMVYIAILQVFLDAGVPAAVIQREQLDDRHLDSAFWMMLAWCVLLAGFAFGTAGLWAQANGEPDLKPVIQVLSIWLVIMGLTVVQQAILRREMRFKPLAVRANVGALAGAGVGIGLAVAGYGVWALVAEQIATALVGLVLLWAISDWRPGLRFSRRHARDLLGFSLQGLLGDLGGYIGRRADYLLIGVFLGPTVVGLYRLADRLVDGVLSVTTTPVGTVSLSHFSRLQADAPALRRAVLGSVRATSLMNVPALLLLSGSATAVTGLLGSQWLPAADALKILAVVGIAKALTILVSPLLYALARLRLRLLVIWSLTAVSVGAFAITGLALQGRPLDAQVIWTAASRGILFALVFVPVSLAVLSRFGGVRLGELGQTFVRPGIAGVAGGLVAFALSDSGVLDHLPAIVTLLVVGTVGGGVTLGLLVALDESVRTRVARLVQRLRRRARVEPTVGGAAMSDRAERAELLLVCSTGGHLLQLVALREVWEEVPRAWVTFDKSDARSLLAGERRVFYAHGPTNRNIPNLLRNLRLAFTLLRRLRPRVVLTTGAGVAVPFVWIGRLFGARAVYVESFTRIDKPSLSLRLIAPFADRVYAQWPELRAEVPKARSLGSVFVDP